MGLGPTTKLGHSKGNSEQSKETKWEKTFASHTFDKGLITSEYR